MAAPRRSPSAVMLIAAAIAAVRAAGFAHAQETAAALAPVTAFVDVAVVPMDSARVLAHQTVVVRGDRIVALGPARQVPVPAGATRIDGRGKYLIPGLADMHAHVPGIARLVRAMQRARGNDFALALAADERLEAERMLTLYAAAGVTTVRILHGSPDILALRARAAAGALLGPRIYTSTPILGDMPPDSVAHIPAAAKAAGYDLLKTYGMHGAELDSLVAAARRAGMPIAGHAPEGDRGIDDAIRAGYASIEHLTGFFDGIGGGELRVDSTHLPALATGLRQAGIWICPTLVQLGRNAGYFTADSFARWPELRYVSDTTRQRWTDSIELYGGNPIPPADSALPTMIARRRVVTVLRDNGVGLLLGTDAGLPGLLPGFTVHRELEEFVNAGLTPYEALATGTRNVAAYFGTQDSAGTVAVGKRADLVLLDGDPLRDIRQTTHRAGVMLGGRWFSRAELDRRLAALESTLF